MKIFFFALMAVTSMSFAAEPEVAINIEAWAGPQVPFKILRTMSDGMESTYKENDIRKVLTFKFVGDSVEFSHCDNSTGKCDSETFEFKTGSYPLGSGERLHFLADTTLNSPDAMITIRRCSNKSGDTCDETPGELTVHYIRNPQTKVTERIRIFSVDEKLAETTLAKCDVIDGKLAGKDCDSSVALGAVVHSAPAKPLPAKSAK